MNTLIRWSKSGPVLAHLERHLDSLLPDCRLFSWQSLGILGNSARSSPLGTEIMAISNRISPYASIYAPGVVKSTDNSTFCTCFHRLNHPTLRTSW